MDPNKILALLALTNSPLVTPNHKSKHHIDKPKKKKKEAIKAAIRKEFELPSNHERVIAMRAQAIGLTPEEYMQRFPKD
jgi:hypothetical protein